MRLGDGAGIDAYTRKARIRPGLLVVTPIALLSLLPGFAEPLARVIPLMISLGSLLLMADLVRYRGKQVQERLVARWDGLPTTRMLRLREPQNQTMLSRRRRALEALAGSPLPTKRQELANPARADEVYIAANRLLISRVRASADRFPLAEQESAAYGYARNLLGVKPAGVAVAAASIMTDLVLGRGGASPLLVVVAGLHLAVLCFWLFFVREPWVRTAAETYAERLFEALDLLEAVSPASEDRGAESEDR